MTVEMVQPEVGSLSRTGVLDVGLRFPHSRQHCYYSFLDGSNDHFRAMRFTPWRPVDECKRASRLFAAHGLNRLAITVGQLFDPEDPTSRHRLPKALLEDAELTEILLSVHAVEPMLYESILGGDF